MYSPLDIEFLKKIAGSEEWDLANVIAGLMWSFGSKTSITVPKKFSLRLLDTFIHKDKTREVHDTISRYRNELMSMALRGDVNIIIEAKEIAKQAAELLREANEVLRSSTSLSRIVVTLGFISQIPLNIFLPSLPNDPGNVLTTILQSAIAEAITKVAEHVLGKYLLTDEEVFIVPVMPMIYNMEVV